VSPDWPPDSAHIPRSSRVDSKVRSARERRRRSGAARLAGVFRAGLRPVRFAAGFAFLLAGAFFRAAGFDFFFELDFRAVARDRTPSRECRMIGLRERFADFRAGRRVVFLMVDLRERS
jgi:hypothetical protein